MTNKREVWIVEENGAPIENYESVVHAYVDKPGAEYAKDYLKVYPRTNVVIIRYIPEPAAVEGWPEKIGWYFTDLPVQLNHDDILEYLQVIYTYADTVHRGYKNTLIPHTRAAQ